MSAAQELRVVFLVVEEEGVELELGELELARSLEVVGEIDEVWGVDAGVVFPADGSVGVFGEPSAEAVYEVAEMRFIGIATEFS